MVVQPDVFVGGCWAALRCCKLVLLSECIPPNGSDQSLETVPACEVRLGAQETRFGSVVRAAGNRTVLRNATVPRNNAIVTAAGGSLSVTDKGSDPPEPSCHRH